MREGFFWSPVYCRLYCSKVPLCKVPLGLNFIEFIFIFAALCLLCLSSIVKCILFSIFIFFYVHVYSLHSRIRAVGRAVLPLLPRLLNKQSCHTSGPACDHSQGDGYSGFRSSDEWQRQRQHLCSVYFFQERLSF